MKSKLLNVALILTSVIVYLEWGHDSSSFLFAAEGEVIVKLFTHPVSAVHPFTLIPLIGQLLLLISVFPKKPSKALTYTGMGCLAILILFILFIGIISLNIKIIASVFPFIITCMLTIMQYRKAARS